MPKEITYRQMLGSLKNTAERDRSDRVIASIIAASLLMQWDGGGSICDQDAVDNMAVKLMKQKGFKELMKDPLTARMAREGRHLEMVQLLDVKENEIRKSVEDYIRPKDRVRQDAGFLKEAVDCLKNGSAKGRPAELEKKNRNYQEMIKQVEAAQQKAEQGIQLSAAENKAMITAVTKYIDGGTKVAGGQKKAPHYKEAMCVLREYMPEDEFRKYCNRINESHPKRKELPQTFTRDRMQGRTFTADELRRQAKKSLARGFSEDGCATVVAVRNLSKGNRNTLITPEALRQEKERILQSGSAFRRAITNEKDREMFKELAGSGKINELSKALASSTRKHSIGAMQWRMNRSIRMLTEGPVNQHYATEYLSSIYLAHNIASQVDPGTVLDSKAFDRAKLDVQRDPAFRRMVHQYSTDPKYRARINKDLQLDKTGSIVALEIHKIKNPEAQRQAGQEQPRQERQPEPARRQDPVPA